MPGQKLKNQNPVLWGIQSKINQGSPLLKGLKKNLKSAADINQASGVSEGRGFMSHLILLDGVCYFSLGRGNCVFSLDESHGTGNAFRAGSLVRYGRRMRKLEPRQASPLVVAEQDS